MRTFLRSVALAAIPTFVLVAATAEAGDDLREPLWAAVRNGDAKAVKALLDKGADVNAKNEIGITALWIAASKGQPDIVTVLLEHGADLELTGSQRHLSPPPARYGPRRCAPSPRGHRPGCGTR